MKPLTSWRGDLAGLISFGVLICTGRVLFSFVLGGLLIVALHIISPMKENE